MTNQEYKNLNMVCLYIFTHNITGLKYFGKTTNSFNEKSLLKYGGSGVYWNKHLKVHGKDLSVEIYGIYNLDEVKEIALKFSKDNNIVESLNERGERKGKKIWANEKEEDGGNGGKPSIRTRNIISKNMKNKVICKDIKGNTYRINREIFHLNTSLVGINYGNTNPGNNRGMVSCKDSEDELIQVSKKEFDTRKDLVGHQKDTVTVIEISTGKNLRISKETFYNNKDLYQGVQKGKKVDMTLRNKLSKKYNLLHENKIIKANVLALDIRNIHRSLERTSKEKPLGYTTQSKVMLNKYNNLLLIGLYVELIK